MEDKKTVRLEEMLPAIVSKIEQGGDVVIPVTGVSMKPTLKAGRDFAVLKKAPEKLKKNDIPFYRREDGSFVLHRIVGEDENGYILQGDNQNVKEYGVRHSQVIAVLTAVERDGARIPVTSPKLSLLGTFRNEIYLLRKTKVRIQKRLGKSSNGKKD